MKTILLVGHRGSGKTSISDALKTRGFESYDLDREIQNQQDASPSQIIADSEMKFRMLEIETLKKLAVQDGSTPRVISVGAGCLDFPRDAIVFWIYRDGWEATAEEERDRLRPEMSFEEELAWMRANREPVWRRRAHIKIEVPAGRRFDRVVNEVSERLTQILSVQGSRFAKKTWIVAPQKDVERAMIDVSLFGLAGIECRSDLVQTLPEYPQMIASLRHPDPDWLSARESAKVFDIDIEYLDLVLQSEVLEELSPRQLILSCHPDRVDPIDLERLVKAARKLSAKLENWKELVFKYAPKIETFDQLGFARALMAPLQKAGLAITFIPQGKRFRFCRILNLPTNSANYIPARLNSCDEASVQAYDFQDWLDHLEVDASTSFRALVGDPVDASQGSFWHNAQSRSKEENLSYLKIPMKQEEVESGLSQLISLNVLDLSVTSPLKKNFAMGEPEGVPRSYGMEILESADEKIRFANTLRFDGKKWIGLDTDWLGMEAALKELQETSFYKGTIALLGRGDVSRAVLAAIKLSDWTVVYHTGARDGWVDAPRSVDLVVNMSGKQSFEDAPSCKAWLDLHYSGTEVHKNALYFTGDTFFEAQAKAQRVFWDLA